MENKKFVLGGGISGLIFAYYNREYKVISPDLGGRLNKDFFKNIIYLHDSRESEKFLNDLNVLFTRRTQMIKYVKDNVVVDRLSKEDKISLIRKKLEDKEYNPKDLNLSTSDYYIPILEFNYGDLIKKISDCINFIQGKVIRITDGRIITEDTFYEYDSVVSTLPANIFWNLYSSEEKPETKSKPVTFVLTDKAPDVCKDKVYDMVYFADDNQKYVRISKKPNSGKNCHILYEFTGEVSKEECVKHLPLHSEILEYYVDNQGIIFTNKNNLPPKNVLFIGRFATWNHSDKQQDVIKESLFNYDFRHIFNRQSNFTKFHIDFNRLNDVEYKESLTKDYLLFLSKEVSEVLDEINYKHHVKNRKKVNEDSVREELIDCQKFLFNLMIIWGINADLFIKIFNKKSDIVEQKFINQNS